MVSNKVASEEALAHDYEMVVVINPELAEEGLEAAIETIKKFVGDRGGSVSDAEHWGKRKLAYPIRHFGEGSYVLMRFKLDPVHGRELESTLKISEQVLRHLLIRLGD